MDFLGIGLPELVFIFLIILIVIGPKDMVKTGRTIGHFLNRIVRSEGWQSFRKASRDLGKLPNRLMREAGLEELEQGIREANTIRKEIDPRRITQEMTAWQRELTDWTTSPESTPEQDIHAKIAAQDSQPVSDEPAPEAPVEPGAEQ